MYNPVAIGRGSFVLTDVSQLHIAARVIDSLLVFFTLHEEQARGCSRKTRVEASSIPRRS